MVRNISKNGTEIKDISKITVPINNKAYEIIARGKNEREKHRKCYKKVSEI